MSDEVVQYLIARKDLDMPPGKLAAQVAHAAVLVVNQVRRSDDQQAVRWMKAWERGAYTKIVLEVDLRSEFDELAAQLMKERILFSTVQDAGRTVLEAGTLTVLGVQPMPKSLLVPILGGLRTYR